MAILLSSLSVTAWTSPLGAWSAGFHVERDQVLLARQGQCVSGLGCAQLANLLVDAASDLLCVFLVPFVFFRAIRPALSGAEAVRLQERVDRIESV